MSSLEPERCSGGAERCSCELELKISEESINMKFLHAIGPIAISLAVWLQLIAENEGKIWHIVPSLWQTTVQQLSAKPPSIGFQNTMFV